MKQMPLKSLITRNQEREAQERVGPRQEEIKLGIRAKPRNVRNKESNVGEENKEPKEQASTSLSSSHKGSSILIDKKYEPL